MARTLFALYCIAAVTTAAAVSVSTQSFCTDQQKMAACQTSRLVFAGGAGLAWPAYWAYVGGFMVGKP